MTEEVEAIAEAYDAAVRLALLLGAKSIKDLPGAYVAQVDEHWTFAINGKKEPVEVNLGEASMGIEKLEPYHMAIWFNGWLAGLLTPRGGCICAGEAGNEDNFIKAVEARIAQEKTTARTNRIL